MLRTSAHQPCLRVAAYLVLFGRLSIGVLSETKRTISDMLRASNDTSCLLFLLVCFCPVVLQFSPGTKPKIRFLICSWSLFSVLFAILGFRGACGPV